VTQEIILAILEIFGVFGLGYYARHLGYINETDLNRWSRLVIDFLFPLLAFATIVRGFQAERFAELVPLPLIAFGLMAFGSVCGYLFRQFLKTDDPDVRKTFHHFCAINNYSFLPIIIIQNLWGEEALANLFFFTIGSSIGYWTIGVALLGNPHPLETLKKIVSPNLVAVFLALALVLTGWRDHLPNLVLNISARAGAAAVPTMLILIGATLYPFPSMKNKRDLAWLVLVRLVILPFLMVAILKILPISEDVFRIAFVVALMPAAVSSTLITRRYGGSPQFAAQAAILTTLLSVLTVPFWLWLFGG